MTASTSQRVMVHYTGRVQGVGFRYTTCSIARRHDVSGYVRNLADGSVELVAEGERREVDALLRDIRDEFGGYIRDESSDRQAATGEFGGFGIRY